MCSQKNGGKLSLLNLIQTGLFCDLLRQGGGRFRAPPLYVTLKLLNSYGYQIYTG